MNYQVIARKWRPQSFQEMVGQLHISTTLTNALRNGRVPHALLFTGPRGTGKTSSARIVAKALRCPEAVDFVPCGKCQSCIEIAQGSSIDVIEIDGASNNGVDAIRELRETVGYMPSSGKYKIYIIDEVHMLSTSAFNALLKTLEEPPPHVVFILATTEVQKIPQTILSRCQRFDFRRIPTRQIADHIKHICQSENIQFEDDALWLIARQGDGSMRDALSLLDQVITFTNSDLSRTKVIEILGLTDQALMQETLYALLHRDTSKILQILEKLNESALEPELFAQSILESLRTLLLVKVSQGQVQKLVDLPDSELTWYADQAKDLSEAEIHLLFDMALKGAQDITRSQDPRLVFEVILLRMASAPKLMDLKNLLAGGEVSPKLFEGKSAPAVVAKTPPPPKPKKKAQGATPSDRWINFVELIRQDDALFAAKVENLLFVKEEGKSLQLGVPPKLIFLREQMREEAIRSKLQGFIDSYWGEGFTYEVLAGREAPQGHSAQALNAQKKAVAEDEIRQKLLQNPKVLAAQKVFKGTVKEIK